MKHADSAQFLAGKWERIGNGVLGGLQNGMIG